MIINSITFVIVLNTLQLCGIKHTCFRGTKRLATAEAQTDLLKGQRRCHNASASLIYQSAAPYRIGFAHFLYEMSAIACFEQVWPFDLLVLQESR